MKSHNEHNQENDEADDKLFVIAVGDPRLSDDERKFIFELGNRLYGQCEKSLDEVAILTLEEAQKGAEELREKIRDLNNRLLRVRNIEARASAILVALKDDSIPFSDI